jgi:hypothetical protein
LCLAASRATSTLPGGQGGVQLFMLVGTPAAARPAQPEPTRPAPSAGFGQLRLSKAAAARVAAHPSPGQRPRLRPADHRRCGEHQQLLAAVVGYGQARGWSLSTLWRVQRSLAALLASQPTPTWPLEAAAPCRRCEHQQAVAHDHLRGLWGHRAGQGWAVPALLCPRPAHCEGLRQLP